MISFENATQKVRDKFPKLKIREGFVFRNKYLFKLYSTDHVENSADPNGFKVYVMPDGDVVTIDTNEIFNHLDEYEQAQNKAVVVDG